MDDDINIVSDMLQLSPAETIIFQHAGNELTGNVTLKNVSKKAVTYKVRITNLLFVVQTYFFYYIYNSLTRTVL